MPATRVLILGGSGMLGAMLTDVLSKDTSLQVTATVRTPELLGRCIFQLPSVGWEVFDAESFCDAPSQNTFTQYDYIINAIGIIKPYIVESDPHSVLRAIRLNTLFVHAIAEATAGTSTQIIQIATDCVYSGGKGGYVESDQHDPLDVYGKTKSLSEINADTIRYLRCSIIGPEVKDRASLLEWLLGQQPSAHISGYTDHAWNGITTFHFAKLCQGIISHRSRLPALLHILPHGIVTKAHLLHLIARIFDRSDIQITDQPAPYTVDRTLETQEAEENHQLWANAGYAKPPSIEQMLVELHGHDMSINALDTEVVERSSS